MNVVLPQVLVVNASVKAGRYRKLYARTRTVSGILAPFRRGRLEARLFQPNDGTPEILIVPAKAKAPKEARNVIASDAAVVADVLDISDRSWSRHEAHVDAKAFDGNQDVASVRASWIDAFRFVVEDSTRGVVGLRLPQLGAMHAAHAHWSTSEDTATIVMPTGTGKTDTMIALLVSTVCERLLVVVPTDALRTQLADKFLTLGVLRAPHSRLLASTALYPSVGTLEHVPQSSRELDAIVTRSHVLITTSTIAARCTNAVQRKLADNYPYLFIDEAHHAEAPTWKAFKAQFAKGRIVQFTATPFREDGRPLDGRVIYKYPLRKAQAEGYFKPIKFRPVTEYNRRKVDAAIANRAVEQLREDYQKGHILMARVGSVDRAEEVYELYKPHAQFNPVQLHSGIKSATDREQARHQILTGESRIVVCVDMLGEGFDLPELKIAAFHDIRKSLAVTLQLAGRFTRSRSGLGDAVFIANTADVDVQDELRKLYTRDPDWNALLPELSERAIAAETELKDFLETFGELPAEIPLKDVRPATSAVAYRTTTAEWTPRNFDTGIPGLSKSDRFEYAISEAERTLVVVVARRAALRWTLAETLYERLWELYIAYWSREQQLLFLHGSSNSGEYRALARALCGDEVSLVSGSEVFRSFAGITRLRLQSVGLTEQLGRNVRFTNKMGSHVGPAVTDVHRARGIKSVIAGAGFENGARASVGASRRGRIWSHRREPINRFTAWCRAIGQKVLDASIDPEAVLEGTLRTDRVSVRPAKFPLAIDWPEEIYEYTEASWSILMDDREFPLSAVSIELVAPGEDGPLAFRLVSDDLEIGVVLELFETAAGPNCRFVVEAGRTARIRRGESEPQELGDFFSSLPPVIRFADGSSLEGNELVVLKTDAVPYDRSKLVAWDWAGTDIMRESQGRTRDAATVQARVIREVCGLGYEVVMDDDDPGELADVVAIRRARVDGHPCIEVALYHCKFSEKSYAGARVGDLYEVCGQAQKCVSWMVSPERQTGMFVHLLYRNADREEKWGGSRFEVGTPELLEEIREMSRTNPVSVQVFVVQPGVSKAKASRHQLELLSVTENHLMETYQLPFTAIVSA